MLCRVFLILFILSPEAVLAQPVGDQNYNPQRPISRSVDCAKVSASVEFIICANSSLAQRDAQMSQAYGLRLARLGRDETSRRELIEAQSRWTFQRDTQCNQIQLTAVKSCIIDMTRARLEVLQKPDDPAALTGSVSPSGVPITSQTWDLCAGKEHPSADLQIGACTTIIDSGQEMPEDLGIAFGNRGNSYQATRDFRSAVADYDRAIQLNPNDSIMFGNRGIAYGSEGEIERAIADFSEAIRLNPNFAEALAHRGLLRLKKGDKTGNDDIKAAESLKPELVREITRERALPATPSIMRTSPTRQ
jgi:uncharacterized protein YecT (DUF1311 family)